MKNSSKLIIFTGLIGLMISILTYLTIVYCDDLLLQTKILDALMFCMIAIFATSPLLYSIVSIFDV